MIWPYHSFMFFQKYKNIHPHKDMYNNAHTIGEEEGLGRIRRGKLNSMKGWIYTVFGFW